MPLVCHMDVRRGMVGKVHPYVDAEEAGNDGMVAVLAMVKSGGVP
jgi:hypothetical protein